MRIGRFAFGECSSLTLPPEGDDAISPHSPLRPPRKSFAYALRTAAVPPGRRIGTRECSKSLRYRCGCLCRHTLFQRLALLSDTSLVQSAIRQSLLAPFSTASKRVTIIAFFPTSRCTRIIRLSAERIYRQWNTSANILRYALHGGQRHGSTSSDRSGSEQDIAPSPWPLRLRDTALAALDGVCDVARSWRRFRFGANSFRQAAPKPTYAPTALCCRPLAPFSARA